MSIAAIEPRFVVGEYYKSTTHGMAEFLGMDSYMGEETFMFRSDLAYMTCSWKEETLSQHFEGLK